MNYQKIKYKFDFESLAIFNAYVKKYLNNEDLHIIDRLNIQTLTFKIDELIFFGVHKKQIKMSIDLNILASLSTFFDTIQSTNTNKVLNDNYFAHSVFIYMFELFFKHIDLLNARYYAINTSNSKASLPQ